ncbi:MAG: hypothetical protein ACTTKH_05285 [Treponema sp.]
MFLEYIKLNPNKKHFLYFVKLNIFPSIFEVLNLFILPIVIRKYYIIGKYEAMLLNLIFLFLFEASIIFISHYTFKLYKKEEKKQNLIVKALYFAFLKTTFFLVFLYLFKKAMKISLYLSFSLCFFAMLSLLLMFWLPCLLVKNSFFSSIKKAIHLYLSHPFFTTLIFCHLIILFLFSMILLNIYPGLSKITYNMHLALHIIEEKDAIKRSPSRTLDSVMIVH